MAEDSREAAEIAARVLKAERLPPKPRTFLAEDDYLLERKLGRGGQATVYRALVRRGERSGQRVALKIFDKSVSKSTFAKETSAIRRLDHRAIVQLFGSGISRGRAYLALEYVAGGTLAALMQKRTQYFDRDEVAELFTTVCDAMAFAHEKGVIHRDLKPANILLHQEGARWHPKVADFGLAKLLDGQYATAVGHFRLLGTRQYMAPEQELNLHIDARADIFALGGILFELLTLRRAWVRDLRGRPDAIWTPTVRPRDPDVAKERGLRQTEQQRLLDRIKNEKRPTPSIWRPALPVALDAVVTRALEPDPERRFRSVAELRSAFETALLGVQSLGSLELPKAHATPPEVTALTGDGPTNDPVVPQELDSAATSAEHTARSSSAPRANLVEPESTPQPARLHGLPRADTLTDLAAAATARKRPQPAAVSRREIMFFAAGALMALAVGSGGVFLASSVTPPAIEVRLGDPPQAIALVPSPEVEIRAETDGAPVAAETRRTARREPKAPSKVPALDAPEAPKDVVSQPVKCPAQHYARISRGLESLDELDRKAQELADLEEKLRASKTCVGAARALTSAEKQRDGLRDCLGSLDRHVRSEHERVRNLLAAASSKLETTASSEGAPREIAQAQRVLESLGLGTCVTMAASRGTDELIGRLLRCVEDSDRLGERAR